MFNQLNNLSAGWAALTWAVVWQSTIIAALIYFLCLTLHRASPNIRYWLWQIVAIKLLIMPFWAVAIPMPDWTVAEQELNVEPMQPPIMPIATTGEPSMPGALSNEPGPEPEQAQPSQWAALTDITWHSWLLLTWAAIVPFQLIRLLIQRFRLNWILRSAARAEDQSLLQLVNELAGRLGIRPPQILFTEYQGSPFICGLFRPRLVLPASLSNSIDEQQLRQVMLHELAHVKRRDLLLGWLPEIARIIYFFHPVAWYAHFRIRLERELACDQIAISLSGGDAREYVGTLVKVVSQASRPVVPRAAEGRGDCEELTRLENDR